MATPKQTTWEIEPHTLAKHKILKNYLQAWFPILNKYNGKIIYLDGFAGPGRYSKGEEGSPIIAISTALYHRKTMNGELIFLFVEEREDRAENLKQEISSLELPKHFKVYVKVGEFHQVIGELLNDIELRGINIAPTFAFIDPFGFSGLPFNLVSRILRYSKCEVFITFMVNSINRFIENQDEKTKAHITELFGTEEVLSIPQMTGDRTENLRMLYQSQLNKVSPFVRFFEMCGSDGRPIYFLFFASNHELGHLKMKEAMWRVDTEGDFRFSDTTDPNQTVLFQQDHSTKLFSILSQKFSKEKKLVAELNKFVSNETAYIGKHLKESLRYGEEKNMLIADEEKVSGKKRRKGTFPDDVCVTFL